MCRRSQLLLLVCLTACGLIAALSARANDFASSQVASPAQHSTATLDQQHRADSPSWWNQVAEETSDAPTFEAIATSTGIVTDHNLVACGVLDSFTISPQRDLSLVAQRIRLQI